MSTWEKLADLPLEIETYDLEPLAARRLLGLHAAVDRDPPARRRRGRRGGGRDLRRARPRRGPGRRARCIRSPARTRWRASPSWSAASTSSRLSPSATSLASTAAGPMNLRPWISRCGRRAARCTRSSAARCGRSRSWSRCGSASRRPSTPLERRLERYPTLRFKLDPTNDWDDALVAELVATGAVDSVDMKGLYKGTVVDVETDPVLYERVVTAFPDAWIEDPDLTPEVDEVLRPYRDRVTWDANIHSVADIEGLPFPPRMVNIKPSRFGSIEALTAAYDFCEARRHRRLRRRAVRARSGPRPDPVPRVAVSPRHAERHGAERLQPRRPAARPAGEPARARALSDRVSLGGVVRRPRMRRVGLEPTCPFGQCLLRASRLTRFRHRRGRVPC